MKIMALPIVVVVLWMWFMFIIVAASNPCVRSGPLLYPINQTGWHGEVKCYDGEVVDYR